MGPGVVAESEANGATQKNFREFDIPQPQPPWRMRLATPIEYNNETFTELVFDFDNMTARDFIKAHREFMHSHKPERNETPFPDIHPLYHVIIAAHRADVPRGVIERLPAAYWNELRKEILKVCGGSPDKE